MSHRRIKAKAGDVFAFRLKDGSFGLGHVAWRGDMAPTFVLFAKRARSIDEMNADLDTALKQPIGVLVATDPLLANGEWPIIAFRPPDYPNITLPRAMDGKSVTYTLGYVPSFVEAYYGLRPWDEFPTLPALYRDILLPHLPIPPTVRYKRDFAADAAAVSAIPKPEPVTEGPAEIHIQIVYPGIEEVGAGEVGGAESGGGVMEIFLRTDDVRRSTPLIEQALKEHGFQDDALIEAMPLEDDDEDEEGNEA